MTTHFELHRYPWIVVDVEATGLKWWSDTAFGVSVTVPEANGMYDHEYYDLRDMMDREYILRELPRAKLIVGHHVKYDAHMLREAGCHMSYERLRCTMIREALLDEHRLSYDLDSLAWARLKKRKQKDLWQALADAYGGKATRKAQIHRLVDAPREVVKTYACQDSDLAAMIYDQQIVPLNTEDLGRVHALEFRLLPHIIRMEENGVAVDLDYAEKLSKKLGREIKTAQRKLDNMAGFAVNVNPSLSLQRLIAPTETKEGWIAKDGTLLARTEGGAASITAEALRSMKMPEATLVLAVRQLRSLKEVQVDGHVLRHHHNGIIHATINQTKNDQDRGTGTGRFSIQDPALQQIHKRNKKLAALVRPCFLPDAGQVWQCRDWEQMDFRIFAHYTKNPRLLAQYAANPDTDFHSMVAEITKLPRNRDEKTGGGNAKQINLGLVFGMGPGRMAQEMGLPCLRKTITDRRAPVVPGQTAPEKVILIPGEEAEEVFAKYHEAIPGVKTLLEDASALARSRGYVTTIMGRRIRFPGGQFTHKAGGLVFQGTAAECLKIKMCELCEYYKDKDARLMLVVHDEFDSSLPLRDEGMRREIKRIVEEFDGVRTPFTLRVPIRSSGGEGPNWWEASK